MLDKTSLDLSKFSEFGLNSEVESDSEDRLTSTGGSEAGTSPSSSAARHEIGKEETRMVFGSKILVIVVLVVATLLCGAGAYGFTVRTEQEIFISQVSQSIKIRQKI